MVAPAPTYDLMLMLDPKAEQATRTKIRSDVKAMIEQGGSIIGDLPLKLLLLDFQSLPALVLTNGGR